MGSSPSRGSSGVWPKNPPTLPHARSGSQRERRVTRNESAISERSRGAADAAPSSVRPSPRARGRRGFRAAFRAPRALSCRSPSPARRRSRSRCASASRARRAAARGSARASGRDSSKRLDLDGRAVRQLLLELLEHRLAHALRREPAQRTVGELFGVVVERRRDRKPCHDGGEQRLDAHARLRGDRGSPRRPPPRAARAGPPCWPPPARRRRAPRAARARERARDRGRAPGPPAAARGRSPRPLPRRARSAARFSGSLLPPCSPGVSSQSTCASGRLEMPRMRLRVVCGFAVTIASF